MCPNSSLCGANGLPDGSRRSSEPDGTGAPPCLRRNGPTEGTSAHHTKYSRFSKLAGPHPGFLTREWWCGVLDEPGISQSNTPPSLAYAEWTLYFEVSENSVKLRSRPLLTPTPPFRPGNWSPSKDLSGCMSRPFAPSALQPKIVARRPTVLLALEALATGFQATGR